LIPSTSKAQENIGRIMAIFRHIQEEIVRAEDLDAIFELLQREDPEYRSIAYEAAAMELAVQDLSDGISLDKWYSLRDKAANEHAVHIHVGLGWALAKLHKAPTKFIENMQPLLKWRVVDGMGYYFGLFNKRRTQSKHEIPDLLTEDATSPFDQGVGRSIWYTSGAEIGKAALIIGDFSGERKADLWRGIGIACAYVGGCTERELGLIYQAAGDYQKQLVCGATLACRTRYFAEAHTEASNEVIEAWSNMNAEEAYQLSVEQEPSADSAEGDEYKDWILRIADALKTRIA